MFSTISTKDLLGDTPLTFLDVETTGTSPRHGDRIIEIAILQVRGSEVVAHVDALLDPQRSLKSGAMRGMVNLSLGVAPQTQLQNRT